MKEVIRREKEAGINPDPDVDTYMKAKTRILIYFTTRIFSFWLSNKQVVYKDSTSILTSITLFFHIQAISVEGLERSIQTDYIMKV